MQNNKYKRELRKVITIDELSFDDKNVIKNSIRKLIEFTNLYQKPNCR